MAMSINSPVRQVKAKVELYGGSTLAATFSYMDKLKSFTIDGAGEGKFFGFGVVQKLNLKLMDKDRELSITTANSLKVYAGLADGSYELIAPSFYVTEVNRDENTNELSITAYDALYAASKRLVSELTIAPPYTIGGYVGAISAALGLEYSADLTAFNLSFTNGANFNGSETFRAALDDAAEATQTIYFIDAAGQLKFKRLVEATARSVTRDDYFTLKVKDNKRLSKIVNANELGDNVSVDTGVSGSTQYVRDNAFWSLREDIATLLDDALVAVGGMTIAPFEMEWRGNYQYEFGDKLNITTKDGSTALTYLLDSSIEYNGGLRQRLRWEYQIDDNETASNPNSIGDNLKNTAAKVDKVNQEISLVVSDVSANTENISSLRQNQDRINISVTELRDNLRDSNDAINDDIDALREEVSLAVTSQELTIEVSRQIGEINSVTTTTGFRFDETGLNVSKTGSEMTTQITEDGMKVMNNGSVTLTANNAGVDAKNLRATTYLIVGSHSRFEDYGSGRTGCFYIN